MRAYATCMYCIRVHVVCVTAGGNIVGNMYVGGVAVPIVVTV